MNEETVTIILPLPPSILSPNHVCATRGGRMARYSASKKYRTTAKVLALATGVKGWDKATVQASFFHSTNRRRDDINHMAMLKSAYDGIVDAGLISDDDHLHLTTLPALFSLDKKNPRVDLKFTRKE